MEETTEKKSSNTIKQFNRSVKSVLTGSFLTREQTISFLPFFLFLSLLAIAYIANGYYAEGKIRKLIKLNDELKELKSEYITGKSDLMFISKQSEVERAVEPLGLKQSVMPPKKIIIKNKQLTTATNRVGD